ncbi:D-alanine--D-alanine ligase [Nocardioides mangrovicus]|uniref:D-alanine--D-alanine ligase n=1 Tax=Nocardioides mangrovicus TaxID=2478913 RepID=A0A3L8P7M5_9ACTN|nr:D-alanine--D-alanine ligase family protein [Nocardioides mangrovicus]RLV51154.1 D-alanine--D-alanine ligase [Nocardioides mangrovicus]
MSGKPRVAVVFGGRSSEHAISCLTAGSVIAAIDPEAYDVVPVGIARDGRWVLESGESDRLQIGSGGALPEVDATRPLIRLHQSGLVVNDAADVPSELGDVDVVMPLLHGPFGEDGTLQGLLEMAGVRYVGAGVLSSAISMDKHYMKVVLQSAGLPVLPHVLITPRGWTEDPEACRESVRALGFPVFVKPCRGGSSIGISRVDDESGLDAAVEAAREHDPRVLVEAGAGEGCRELECGVLESLDGAPQASVVAEIVVAGDHAFYDFEAKYLPDQDTLASIPADLPDDVADRVRAMALRTFAAVDAEGLARVDFFLQPDGTVVVNELNTMPGFTPTSMFPMVWKAAGIDYPALVDRLLRLALAREPGLR